jgi:hypothetical protein
MKIENIHYHTTGFLKDAKYTTELLSALSKYKDEFGAAESLVLNLEEIPPGLINFSKKETVVFSGDGKEITINLTSQKYTNTKGKVTGTPEPYSVYQTIHFVLKRAVKEYKEKFINDNDQ